MTDAEKQHVNKLLEACKQALVQQEFLFSERNLELIRDIRQLLKDAISPFNT